MLSQSSTNIDSLLHLLDESKVDTNQLQINREIAKYYYDINTNKSIEYYQRSKELAEKLGNKRIVAVSNYSLGIGYSATGNFDKAIEHLLLAARYFEENNFSRNISITYTDIANLFAKFQKYEKAYEYFAKAENYLLILKDTFEMGYLYTGISSLFYLQGKFDSAITYNRKIMTLTAPLEDKSFMQTAYSNIGLLYKKKKEYEKALKYTDTAFHLAESNEILLSTLYNNYGCIYTEMHKFPQAEKALRQSLDLSRLTNSVNTELENYKNLAELFELKGDYKNQNEYLKKYFNLKDSLFSAENKIQFNQLESDYQLENKDKLIFKSNLETTKQKNARNVFLLISLFTLGLLSLLFFYYKKLKFKNKIVEQQKHELITLNQVKDRLFSIISHDLRNPLITLKSYLMLSDNESISQDKKILFKNQTMSAVSQTSDLLDNLLTWANLQIKNSSPNIVPISIQECVSDVDSILEYQAKQKNITIIQKIDPINIPADMDILSIALRNLITNAIKYSFKDSNIIIESIQHKDYIHLIVEDHGQGISSEKLSFIQRGENDSTTGTSGEKGTGLGLYLVKEMLKKINAQLLIESELNQGSKFIIQIPRFN